MKFSVRPALAAVAAAALLVAGTDLVTHAATGDSLILGKVNKAGKATKVTNTGRGPALDLKTGKKFPPLKVNSKKAVKNLNADRVDGKDASALEPTVQRFVLGSNRSPLQAQDLRRINVAPGWYHVTMAGLLTKDDVLFTPGVVCYVGDGRVFQNPGTADPDLLYLAHFSDLTENSQSAFADADVARVLPGAEVFFGCAYGSPEDPVEVEQTRALRVSFRPIAAVTNGPTQNYVPPTPRAARELGRLLTR